jgi:hypothetical protein
VLPILELVLAIGIGAVMFLVVRSTNAYSWSFLISPLAWMLQGLRIEQDNAEGQRGQPWVKENPWEWKNAFYGNLFQLLALIVTCIAAFCIDVPGRDIDNLGEMFEIWGQLSTYIDLSVWVIFGVGLGTTVLAYGLAMVACSMNMLFAFWLAASVAPWLCLGVLELVCTLVNMTQCDRLHSTGGEEWLQFAVLATGQFGILMIYFSEDISSKDPAILLKETQVIFFIIYITHEYEHRY